MEISSPSADICGGESREYIAMDIDEELLQKLYASTKPANSGNPELHPTPRQLQILRDLWGKPTVRKTDVAKALGVCGNVARRWYAEMVEKQA